MRSIKAATLARCPGRAGSRSGLERIVDRKDFAAASNIADSASVAPWVFRSGAGVVG